MVWAVATVVAALVGECGRGCDGDDRNHGNGDRPTSLVMFVTGDGDGRVTERPPPLIKLVLPSYNKNLIR